MKKVLITGIDSFTGIYLSSYLENFGYELFGTSHKISNSKKNVYKTDITDIKEIKKVLDLVKPNYVIHLAGISFPAHGHMEDFYKVNTIGALNILDALLELQIDIKKVILVSSAIVYGNQGIEILNESLSPMPANHYGASKFSMECLSRNYFDKIPILILRSFNYTGIGQPNHFLIPKIVNHYKKKESTIELGNLEVIREFNDVGYVCEIYKKLLECDNKDEVVNLCSGRGIKLLEVIDIMNKIAGYNIKVNINPEFVRKNEIKSLTGSTEKLFKIITPTEQKTFENTLRDMFEA